MTPIFGGNRGDHGDRGVAGERGPKGDHGQTGDEGKAGAPGQPGPAGRDAPRQSPPITRRLAIILVVFCVFAGSGVLWAVDRNSCLRQGPPRESANARKAAVDAVVRGTDHLMSAEERADVIAKTKAIPRVPALQCNKVFPDNE